MATFGPSRTLLIVQYCTGFHDGARDELESPQVIMSSGKRRAFQERMNSRRISVWSPICSSGESDESKFLSAVHERPQSRRGQWRCSQPPPPHGFASRNVQRRWFICRVRLAA